MLEFIKVREVKDPIRNVEENAGIDFFIPEKDDDVIKEIVDFNGNITFSGNDILIPAHEDILIPTGIKSKFDKNLALNACNKSGIATKKKLIVGAQLVDSGYQGELHIHLINTSKYTQIISFGQKIVQFVPQIISTEEHIVRNSSEEDFFTVKTERGAGGFGSTGV